MSRMIRAALCLTVVLASAVRADVVVPNTAAGVEADGTFALTTAGAAGRTFQMTIDAGQLSGVVGHQITGMQWRLNGAAAAAWPPADVSYAFWDVFVGPGVDPSAMTNNFASNFTGAVTQVRSGGHSYSAGSFTNGASPNAFGPALVFTTPYVYTGSDLTIEMRFSGQTGTTTTPTFDAVLASGGPGNGWGVNFSARWASSATATDAGFNGNFLATNLLTVIPEPSSMALTSICMAGALLRKPRRR